MLPKHIGALVARVLTSPAATTAAGTRRTVYEYVAALTRGEPPTGIPGDMEPYVRKVALNAYKVLDREVEAMHAAGRSVEEVFEMTVVAAVAAGATRLEMALAALEEAADAPAA